MQLPITKDFAMYRSYRMYMQYYYYNSTGRPIRGLDSQAIIATVAAAAAAVRIVGRIQPRMYAPGCLSACQPVSRYRPPTRRVYRRTGVPANYKRLSQSASRLASWGSGACSCDTTLAPDHRKEQRKCIRISLRQQKQQRWPTRPETNSGQNADRSQLWENRPARKRPQM